MKRIIVCVMIIGLLISTFTGCQEEGTLVISSPLLIDYSDSVFELSCNSEYKLVDENSSFQPAKTMTIEMNGEKYVGSYTKTTYGSKGVSYVAYEYESNSNEKKVLWEVKADGTLKSFGYVRYSHNEEKIMSRESCLAIAESFLKDQIPFSSFQSISSVEDDRGYRFDYTRSINGLPTVELVSVIISFDGKIIDYYARVVDELNDCPDLSQIDFDAVTQILYQRVDTMIDGLKAGCEIIEYEKPEYMITFLKEGTYGLYCDVEVNAITPFPDGSSEIMGNVFTFIIPLVRETKS